MRMVKPKRVWGRERVQWTHGIPKNISGASKTERPTEAAKVQGRNTNCALVGKPVQPLVPSTRSPILSCR